MFAFAFSVILVLSFSSSSHAENSVSWTETPTWFGSGMDPEIEIGPDQQVVAAWAVPPVESQDIKGKIVVSVRVLGSYWSEPLTIWEGSNYDETPARPKVAVSKSGKVIVGWESTNKELIWNEKHPWSFFEREYIDRTYVINEGLKLATLKIEDAKLELDNVMEKIGDPYYVSEFEYTEKSKTQPKFAISCSMGMNSSSDSSATSATCNPSVNWAPSDDLELTIGCEFGWMNKNVYDNWDDSSEKTVSQRTTGTEATCMNSDDWDTQTTTTTEFNPSSTYARIAKRAGLRPSQIGSVRKVKAKRKRPKARSAAQETEGVTGDISVFEGTREDSMRYERGSDGFGEGTHLFCLEKSKGSDGKYDILMSDGPSSSGGMTQYKIPLDDFDLVDVGVDDDGGALAVWKRTKSRGLKGDAIVFTMQALRQTASGTSWADLDITPGEKPINEDPSIFVAERYLSDYVPAMDMNRSGQAVIAWQRLNVKDAFGSDWTTQSVEAAIVNVERGTVKRDRLDKDTPPVDFSVGIPNILQKPDVDISDSGRVGVAWSIYKTQTEGHQNGRAIRFAPGNSTGFGPTEEAGFTADKFVDLGWPSVAVNDDGKYLLAWNRATLTQEAKKNKLRLSIPRNLTWQVNVNAKKKDDKAFNLFSVGGSRQSGTTVTAFGFSFRVADPKSDDVYKIGARTRMRDRNGAWSDTKTLPQAENLSNEYVGDTRMKADGTGTVVFDGSTPFTVKAWDNPYDTTAGIEKADIDKNRWWTAKAREVGGEVIRNPYNGRPLYIEPRSGDSDDRIYIEQGDQYSIQAADIDVDGSVSKQDVQEVYQAEHTTVWPAGVDGPKVSFDDQGNEAVSTEYTWSVGYASRDKVAPTIKSYPENGKKAYTLPKTEAQVQVAAADLWGLKSLTVNFGDQTKQSYKGEDFEGIPSAYVTPTHEWKRPGIYRMTIEAEDLSGNKTRSQFTVQVLAIYETPTVTEESIDLSTSAQASFTIPGVPSWWFANDVPAPPASFTNSVTDLPVAEQKPSIWEFSLTRKKFAVSSGATAKSAIRAGTKFKVGLTASADVKIKLYRLRKGKRKLVGTLSRKGLSEGSTKISFTGRIGKKVLKVGNYQAIVRAANSAGSSSSRKVKFKIAKNSNALSAQNTKHYPMFKRLPAAYDL